METILFFALPLIARLRYKNTPVTSTPEPAVSSVRQYVSPSRDSRDSRWRSQPSGWIAQLNIVHCIQEPVLLHSSGPGPKFPYTSVNVCSDLQNLTGILQKKTRPNWWYLFNSECSTMNSNVRHECFNTIKGRLHFQDEANISQHVEWLRSPQLNMLMFL